MYSVITIAIQEERLMIISIEKVKFRGETPTNMIPLSFKGKLPPRGNSVQFCNNEHFHYIRLDGYVRHVGMQELFLENARLFSINRG